MSVFDNLKQQAGPIAAKAGISPDMVRASGQTLQDKLKSGMGQGDALQATAREHGLSVDKLQEMLGHAGSSGDLKSEIGGFAKKILG